MKCSGVKISLAITINTKQMLTFRNVVNVLKLSENPTLIFILELDFVQDINLISYIQNWFVYISTTQTYATILFKPPYLGVCNYSIYISLKISNLIDFYNLIMIVSLVLQPSMC